MPPGHVSVVSYVWELRGAVPSCRTWRRSRAAPGTAPDPDPPSSSSCCSSVVRLRRRLSVVMRVLQMVLVRLGRVIHEWEATAVSAQMAGYVSPPGVRTTVAAAAAAPRRTVGPRLRVRLDVTVCRGVKHARRALLLLLLRRRREGSKQACQRLRAGVVIATPANSFIAATSSSLQGRGNSIRPEAVVAHWLVLAFRHLLATAQQR